MASKGLELIIFSDIHANIDAGKALVDLLKKETGASSNADLKNYFRFIVLGDTVGRNNYPNEVMDLVMRLQVKKIFSLATMNLRYIPFLKKENCLLLSNTGKHILQRSYCKWMNGLQVY